MKMMKINPRTISYVSAVAEEKSFSKAAEKLYITQPSLSQHILNAEKEYGVQFFDRKTLPLTLTYAGERFLEIAKEMERLDERLTREMEDITENVSGRICVGVTATRGAFFIPRLFSRFKASHPRVELVLMEGSNAQLLDWVKSGKADVAFVGYSDPALHCETIDSLPLLLAVRKDHPLAVKIDPRQPVDLRLFQQEPFILLREGQSIRRIADRFFERAGVRPVIAYETRSYLMALQMAREGLGCTFAINHEIYPTEELLKFAIKGAEDTYPLLLVYREDLYLSRALRDFISLSEEIRP